MGPHARTDWPNARTDSPNARIILLAIGGALVYYLAARLGFVLRFPPATTSVLWPPNALMTAALLLTPPRHWGVYLVALLPAHLLVEAQAGLPISLVLALFATNCSEALLAAALLRRWSDAPSRFDSLRRITAFLGAAVVVAPALTSFADAAAVHVLRGEEYWPVFRTRLFSNALSALTIVPSVVAMVRGVAWLKESPARRRLEAALLTAVISAVGLIVFSSQHAYRSDLPGVPYTLLPFLVPAFMWAAVRFGPGGASLALLATSLAAIRSATLGFGPLGLLTPEEGVVALQVFLTVVGVPLLCLGALIEERRQATAALSERLRFEELLSRLSAAFVHPASHQMDRAFEFGLEQLARFVGVDRVTLRRFTANGELKVAYTWLAPRAPAAPGELERSEVPWAAERLWGKESIVISDLADLPEQAAAERNLLSSHGVRSLLVVPIVAGDQVLGGLGFVATSAPKAWSPSVIEQSRLIADVLASAMARQQAEEAIRRIEATKAAVLASLISYVAVLDRSGRIVTINESWARAALESANPDGEGLGSVGSDHLEFWRRRVADGRAEAGAAIAGITGVLDGSRQSLVLEYKCSAHPGRWYVMAVVPLQAAEGGAVVSLTDVSERKRAELEAQKSRQELAHFLRVSTIGELTASLAHELNQPLAAILANAQAAAHLVRNSRTPGSGELREILADIVAEDRRAGEVIRRLRELLRKGDPERALLDVNALVREVIDLLASDALLRGVSMRLDLHPGRLTVRGDRVQLQQVLLNITINAMEAMTGGNGNDAVVLVRTAAGETGVRISVADTGHGLHAPTPGAVFEPFYTPKPNGLGMGLSIARSIVGAHGGTVEAKNNPTRGATFTVALPVADAGAAGLAPEQASEAALPGTSGP